MPENYIQPVTNRQQCFTCHKTVTGKKKLSKCSRCHAITYCGARCQKADWPRHAWNCVPVMVTEYEGKGRGLVAARDIKMGEFIFLDKLAIKLPIRSSYDFNRPLIEQLCDEDVDSLMRQVDNLPSEAKLMFYKLEAEDCQGDWVKELRIFSVNARLNRKLKGMRLFLNTILLNHSCAPNALNETIEDGNYEVRAIKDISKGEEITIFYQFFDGYTYKKFGCNVRERMQAIKDRFGFDCKCGVCTGDLPDQEDIIKELLELHGKLDPKTAAQEGMSVFVRIIDRFADLSLRLYIGSLEDKMHPLTLMANLAYTIKDAHRLEKAMKQIKKIAEDTKFKNSMKLYEEMMRKFDLTNVPWNKN